MLFIASDKNFNRKSKNQSVLLSMLSEMGIYGILFNFELLKNWHSPECKKWLKWKKYTGIMELTWRNQTFVYKRYYVWDRNLLVLNYNEESLRSLMTNLLIYYTLKPLPQKMGESSLWGSKWKSRLYFTFQT